MAECSEMPARLSGRTDPLLVRAAKWRAAGAATVVLGGMAAYVIYRMMKDRSGRTAGAIVSARRGPEVESSMRVVGPLEEREPRRKEA